jgi:hypothetical protein
MYDSLRSFDIPFPTIDFANRNPLLAQLGGLGSNAVACLSPKRMSQLKNRHNMATLRQRCYSSSALDQLEATKECRKLLSGMAIDMHMPL